MGKSPIDYAIGRELRKLRERAGMNLDEVSSRVHKAATTISEHERGVISISLSDFFAYCEIYGVSPDEVVRTAKNSI